VQQTLSDVISASYNYSSVNIIVSMNSLQIIYLHIKLHEHKHHQSHNSLCLQAQNLGAIAAPLVEEDPKRALWATRRRHFRAIHRTVTQVCWSHITVLYIGEAVGYI